jgi:hypothetical protein
MKQIEEMLDEMMMRPSLAMGTTGSKILLHSPHDTSNENGEMSILIKNKITSLTIPLSLNCMIFLG